MGERMTTAEACARLWHMNQKYGDQPYFVHLQAVHDVLVEFGQMDEDLLAAAWLHDILKDTDYPVRSLAAAFGPHVANLVWAVTGFGSNRKARAEDTARKIYAYPAAATLKCADRIANVRASIGTDKMQMYLKAWADFNRQIVYPFAPIMMEAELVRLHN